MANLVRHDAVGFELSDSTLEGKKPFSRWGLGAYANLEDALMSRSIQKLNSLLPLPTRADSAFKKST